MAHILLSLLIAVIALAGAFATGSSKVYVIKDTTKGKVRGTVEDILGYQVDTFWGIPYAEPPIGELRFAETKDKKEWTGVINATKMPNACPQNDPPQMLKRSQMNTEKSEDCLYLNVWSPHEPPDPSNKRAVMVYIHGGGYYSGSSTLDIANGAVLAAKNDVVVVSMQYRLGVLGFLYYPEGEGGIQGNMGLYDQLATLRWVQSNIHFFGGNKSRVTLFGQSVGATSVLLHTFDLGTHYFQDVIMSSIPKMELAVLSQEEAQKRGERLVAEFDCSNDAINCIRAIDSSSFRKYDHRYKPVDTSAWDFLGIIDIARNFRGRKVMIGTTRNEAIITLLEFIKETREHYPDQYITRPTYERVMNSLTSSSDLLGEVNKIYGVPEHDATVSQMLSALDAIGTDVFYVYNQRKWIDNLVEHRVAVYEYMYDHIFSRTPYAKWLGVVHGSEQVAVFGRPFLENGTTAEKEFSTLLMKYWTNFAKYGDPRKGSPMTIQNPWYVHTRSYKRYIELRPDGHSTMNWGFRGGHCDELEAILRPVGESIVKSEGCPCSPSVGSLLALVIMVGWSQWR